MNRAYSLLHVKEIDVARRLIRKIPTTPSPDRTGDVIEPLGAVFPPELPLLLHHREGTPVGIAWFKAPTKAGIEFEAELPNIVEPGPVKDEVDRAGQSVKHKLIRGMSIGFRVMDDAVEQLKSGGLRFLKTELLELSLVTVPANQDATLTVVKSLDALDLAASGRQQISSFENTRAAKAARMNAIMGTAADAGTTLPAQTEEYGGLASEMKSVDAQLSRLRDMERLNIVSADTDHDDDSDCVRTAWGYLDQSCHQRQSEPAERHGVHALCDGDGRNGSEAYRFSTIPTDKNDYADGETVYVSVSGGSRRVPCMNGGTSN